MTERRETPSTAPAAGKRKRTNPLDAPKRRLPKQKRSRETVDAILKAAVNVMERGGFESLNMRAIADEAGVNVATLYSYFANKHKLLEKLTQKLMDERLAMLSAAYSKAATAPDWITTVCDAIVRLAKLRTDQSGSIAIRQALHASPQLWELDQEGNRTAARLVADLLKKRADPCPANPELRARIMAEYITAILDMKAQYPIDVHPEIDREMVALLRAHLSMP